MEEGKKAPVRKGKGEDGMGKCGAVGRKRKVPSPKHRNGHSTRT